MNKLAGMMLRIQDVLGVGITRATRGEGPLAVREDAVTPFHALILDVPAVVRVIHGELPQVRWRAQANLLPALVATVRQGQLHLDLRGSAWSHLPLEVDVVSPKPLLTVRVNGAADVRLTQLASQATLICRGAGDVRGEGTFERLKVTLSGAGNLSLAGSAECLILEQSGVGNADLSGMQARRASVRAQGVGQIIVQAIEEMRAEVDGLTHVKVRGNPARRQVSCANLGKVSFG